MLFYTRGQTESIIILEKAQKRLALFSRRAIFNTGMKNKKCTAAEIGALIRGGKTFDARTERDRKAALQAALYAGIRVCSRKLAGKPGFRIYFLDDNQTTKPKP